MFFKIKLLKFIIRMIWFIKEKYCPHPYFPLNLKFRITMIIEFSLFKNRVFSKEIKIYKFDRRMTLQIVFWISQINGFKF